MTPSTETALNGWRRQRAEKARVIVDGADYLRCAKEMMLRAERAITLIGWDFDARIEFEPEEKTLEGPNRVGRFLTWLGRKRPDLKIRILKWDTGMIHSIGRAETPVYMARWKLFGPVDMRLDSAHPSLSAHHMKLLVIDEQIAFCGGIDMTVNRWDTPDHDEDRAGRRSPRGKLLDPWHDVTTCVTGPVVDALSELARTRWRLATGETLEPLDITNDLWPTGVEPTFRDVEIAVCRTQPEYGEQEQLCEIEAATLAIIASAERSLYIESQYFASRRIAEAIADRLREEDGPEIVIVNPHTADGWLESKAMDSARTKLVELVSRADRHRRFRMVYPTNPAGTAIYVHAKVMIADDRILKIGSANLNNRSMGFDTECDLVVRAEGDDAVAETIRDLRDGLLAEHLGRSIEDVQAAIGDRDRPLLALLDQNAGDGHRLVKLPMREVSETDEWLAESDLSDPERPRRSLRPLRYLFG